LYDTLFGGEVHLEQENKGQSPFPNGVIPFTENWESILLPLLAVPSEDKSCYWNLI